MFIAQRFVISFDDPQLLELDASNHGISELINIKKLGLTTQEGFILKDTASKLFFSENNLTNKIDDLLSTIHYERADSIMQVSTHIKKIILETKIPKDLENQIYSEYKKLGGNFKSAVVDVGESGLTAKNFQGLIQAIIEEWSIQFSPTKLLQSFHEKSIGLKNRIAVKISKKVNSNKHGTLLTPSNQIKTSSKLNDKENKKLKEIANIISKNYYFPQEISWVIDKNEVYVVRLSPVTNSQKSYLVLVRHGRSEYNEKGLWAGWDDPALTKNGEEDAVIAANTLRDIQLDVGFTSALIRHNMTLSIIKKTLNRSDMPTIISKSLLERNYGDLTRKNKWEIQKQYGNDQFLKWRRGWDDQVPNGESLKDVYNRVVPYYKEYILPKLISGKNAIIVSSGNALRALVKYLDNISDKDISKLEIATGEVYVYQVDEDGNILSKEIRNQHDNKV